MLWWIRLPGYAALGVVVAASAWAQAGVKTTESVPTLSTSSGNCLAQNNFRKALTLDNTGGSINVGYCETKTNTACTAAIGVVGTTTLPAGSLHYWPAGSAPGSQFCFIAASGTPGLTIKEGL